MQMVPIFTLKLNQRISPRLVDVGSYDGKHPSLTGATNGGKVFLHMPHQRPEGSDLVWLNFGQHVTAIAAGPLNPKLSRDVLLIGSQTNLLAYDVKMNSELFYGDVPDGANSILIGNLGAIEEPLVLAGGNCAIKGFNCCGEDLYWTVTGDNVRSMALMDFNMNRKNELLVGSDDYEIRVFENDELMMEMTEADVITSLCPILDNKFAYSLINGVVGMYGESERIWTSKSRSQPMCMHAFDMNEDGIPELVTGWSSGELDIRSVQNGEVLYKDTFGAFIAGIVQADYRMDGKVELICCTGDGEVRGYLPPSQSDVSVGECSESENSVLEQLYQRKQELILELKNFEMCEKYRREEPSSGMHPTSIFIKTHFKTTSLGNTKAIPGIELTVETNNGVTLRAVVVFADGIFMGESFIVHPPTSQLSNILKVPLFLEKDTPSNLQIKAYVGRPTDFYLHIVENVCFLPRFSLYTPCGLDVYPPPQGSVIFDLPERLDRVLDWLNINFLYSPDQDAITHPTLHVAYLSLRTRTPLIIAMDPTHNGRTTIRTDDMDLAGDLITSLAIYLSIEDLAVVADFPYQMQELKTVLEQVQAMQKARQQLTAEMADNSGVIGNLVVRTEDARLMNHMGNMTKALNQLYQLNKDLMVDYKIRSNNHLQLVQCLKTVNQAIRRAGRLRAGKPKTQVITACKKAVKSNDQDALFRVMQYGTP